MRKFLTLLLGAVCALCLTIGVAACNSTTEDPDLGLAISQETATIDITQSSTLQLSATVTASGSYVFSWTSSDKNVATVHPTSGLVTAVSAGTATITVSVREKGTVDELDRKTCLVNVTTPDGYYNIITGTSGIAQNENVKNDPGVWYLYYGSALSSTALYCVKDSVTMNVSALKGTWYLRYYPKFAVGTMLDISFTITLDVDAYIRLSAGGTVAGGGVEYRYLEAGTHDVTLSRVLGDIPFSVSLTTMPGSDSSSGTTDTFYSGDLNMKLTNISFTEGVKLTGPDGNIAKTAYINVAKGETTLQLDALAPAGGDAIVWSSSENGVATVDQNGLVTAVGAGKTVITARSGDKQATCTVSVVTKEVNLNANYIILDAAGSNVAASYQLKAKASDNTPVDVEWSSDNTSVATVDGNGLVTAVAAGSAKVTASVSGMELECTVAVGNSASGEPYGITNSGKDDALKNVEKWFTNVSHSGLTSIAFADGEITIDQDTNQRTVNLLYQPLFEVGAKYSVSFTIEAASGDMGKNADRLQFGTGTGYNLGSDINSSYESLLTNATSLTCTGEFTVSANEPFFITFRVQKSHYSIKNITFTKVADPEKSALTGLEEQSATLTLGDSDKNTATIHPVINLVNSFDEVNLTFTSANPSIATVDADGVVTAVSVGNTTISVSDGTNTKIFTVIVTDGETPPPVILVSISPESATLDKAGADYANTLQIEATFSDASGCELTYTSSNTAIATVSASGLVTAVAAGECTVTVSDGVNSKICTITVVNSDAAKLTGISADGLILDISNSTSSSTAKLNATVTGEGAESVTVTWTSDNTAVATVDQNGNVTAIAAGVANITASDGKNSKTCKVVVGDSANIPASYDAALDKTVNDVLENPGVWYSVGSHTELTSMACTADGLSLTKTGSNARTFNFLIQPFMPVGTRYTVTFTLNYSSGTGWGTTTENFHYGVGTGYSASNVNDENIVTEHATDLKNTSTSHTFTGTFTVDSKKPFFISIKTAKGAFSITDITFTPVSEESTAQVAELEALPANGKENG